MSFLEDYTRKTFDQSVDVALAQIKSVLRILQSQGYAKRGLTFLFTLESIFERGDRDESLRMKLLRVLQPERDETNGEKHTTEYIPDVDIAAVPGTHTYRIFARSTQDPVVTTAQELLDIATWVEQHLDQLKHEVKQENVLYSVRLEPSRVMRLGSTPPEISIEATNAQEAVKLALLHVGLQRMKVVTVRGMSKEERFDDVELQLDHSLTFSQHFETARPAAPLQGEK